MNWKEQFDDKFVNHFQNESTGGQDHWEMFQNITNLPLEVKAFIQTEIIEKLIDDFKLPQEFSELETLSDAILKRKNQLRNKWL